MQSIIDWISSNKEWFFSGIGVAIFSAIGIFAKIIMNKKDKNLSGNNQYQKSGSYSRNVQIGTINKNVKDK
ncbi:MAG: hypothetical protein ABW003_13730 [Microvirga sp.]